MLVVEHCEKEFIGVELEKVLVQLCALFTQQRMRQPSPHPIVDRCGVESAPRSSKDGSIRAKLSENGPFCQLTTRGRNTRPEYVHSIQVLFK